MSGGVRRSAGTVRLALVATTLLVACLGLVRYLTDLPEGLRASYYSTADWTSSVTRSTIDRQPSTTAMRAAWNGRPPEPFSVIWTGSFLVLRGGSYTIAATSDDGSLVYIDGRLVVRNDGLHSSRTIAADIDLDRGVHGIQVNYFQNSALMELEVSWGRDGEPLDPIPSWALTPRRPPFRQFLIDAILRRSLAAAEWLWVTVILVALAVWVWSGLKALVALLRRDVWWRAVIAVIAVSIVINVIGVWCGLSAHTSWLGDELTPDDVLPPLARLFSNGWWFKYPPVEFYVLAAVYSPLLLLQALGRIDPFNPIWYDVMFLAGRLASVAAAVGVLIAVYLSGAETFSKRAGLFACASLALVVIFISYSRTANVDMLMLFWFAWSLVFYLRLVRASTGPTTRDAVLFAATGMLAICTKDQAFALYLATPLVVVHAIWRARRQAGDPHPLGRALLDVRLWAAAAAAVAVFALAHNLLFNFSGFASHVRFIVSDGSLPFRMFEPTLGGRLQLLALTADLDRRSWGWPLFVVTIAGGVMALVSPVKRRATVALLIMTATYYLGFINVILYNYDRFLLPVCVVQALLAGVAFDGWLTVSSRRQSWRPIAVAAVFAYSVLYAGMVDVLMLRDSRYAVEAWLRSRVGPDQLIGTAFQLRNRPRLDGMRMQIIETTADLQGWEPDFYVLDADYARSVPPQSATGALIAGLQQQTLGYTLALRYRAPVPWPWLPGAHPDLAGPRLDGHVFSALRDINPTFEVYERSKTR